MSMSKTDHYENKLYDWAYIEVINRNNPFPYSYDGTYAAKFQMQKDICFILFYLIATIDLEELTNKCFWLVFEEPITGPKKVLL